MAGAPRRNAHLNTYADGPSFKTHGPITTKTIVTLIDALKRLFGDEYDFAPESIIEGGIVFTRWPDMKPGNYKTMRFHLDQQCGMWPRVDDNQTEVWRQQPESIIWSTSENIKILKGYTFLKAMHGAAYWTRTELDLFKLAFSEAGLIMGRMPAAKHLKCVD